MSANVICDLDGVVYVGDQPIAGAGQALQRISDAGHTLVFCTNNSSRTRAQAADKIRRVTGYQATEDQIASSSMAAARLLGRERVLVVGADGVREAVASAGAIAVEDGPVDTVLMGIDFAFDYRTLHAAARAVREGARFIATNTDATYPSPDGLMPGAGSLVAAVTAASGVAPLVAGKPEKVMRAMLSEMVDGRPIVVIGDRIDTDLAMAFAEGWGSIFVETGVTEPGSFVDPVPDHLVTSVADVPDLLGDFVR